MSDPTMSLPNIKTRSSFAPGDVESPREIELHELDDSVNDASDEVPCRPSRTSNREFRSETRLSKRKDCDLPLNQNASAFGAKYSFSF